MKAKKFFYPLWMVLYFLIGATITILTYLCAVFAAIGLLFGEAMEKLDKALDGLIKITGWFKK